MYKFTEKWQSAKKIFAGLNPTKDDILLHKKPLQINRNRQEIQQKNGPWIQWAVHRSRT